ncbi:MAG: cellulase family glycosylhydrolase [bacterium]|nr:cellulase family glycosylhydrolase [bacterium]
MRMRIKRILAALLTLILMITSVELSPTRVTFAAEQTEAVAEEQVSTANPKILRTITETDLMGIKDWNKATKATVYVKVTKGDSNSLINAQLSLGPDAIGKVSSKYLVGRDNTVGKSGNAIQDQLVGDAGTGIYAFPELSLTKTCKDTSQKFEESYANYITIKIQAMSENTDCELVGIKFNNGVTYPADLVIPKCEATSYDVQKTSARELLSRTLEYCKTMDESKYKPESYNEFTKELEAAKTVYEDAASSNETVEKALASLEKKKAALLFTDNTEASTPSVFRELTGDETVYEMGAGINLGNTMDGHSGFTPAETCWQSVVTTKQYIKALHDAGYNTVRIPVTWGTMIDDKNDFAINEAWMNRVQDIVDYCMSLDMYAIINVHHDGAEQTGWLRVASEEIDSVYNKFECVWRNIANKFKDYDEHLIFESMNEITCMEGNDKNSAAAITKDTPVIMNLNQIFVNVVRSTGSNNAKRWIAAVGHYANTGTNTEFSLPEDSYNTTPRIMFGAHIYKSSTNTSWTYSQVYEVVDGLKKMAKKFNVPMYLGEYGNRTYEVSGSATGYNDVERAYFCEIVQKACQVAKVVPIVWDQGNELTNEGKVKTGLFTYWDRIDCKPVFKTITDAMIRGTMLPASEKNTKYDFTDISSGVTVKEITDIDLKSTSIQMTVGQNQTLTAVPSPEDTNDVVLWSSNNEGVATVYRGIVQARGIGTTTICVFSQSGSVEKTIKVIVKADTSKEKSEVVTDQEEYSVVYGGNTQIKATSKAALSYSSSNENIVSVNAFGKLVGKKVGTAYVTIQSAAGTTKMVKVTVTSAIKSTIDVALNVLYNDSKLKYYGTEIGDKITVNGDDQYTVDFDLSKDLSEEGKKAGVTSIANLTAIYIKDYDVAVGNVTTTPVSKASIRYDKVVVNGKELTITNSDFMNTLSSSGVFDSGKPINAWDGNVVAEASSNDHVANFVGIDKPTTISVTFTLQGMEFVKDAPDKTNEATEMKAVGSQSIHFDKENDAAKVQVQLTPVTTDSFVAFTSSDQSVVLVSSDAKKADVSGVAEAELIAAGAGTATVTAKTENGLTVQFRVTVSGSRITYALNGGTNAGDAPVYASYGEEVSLLNPSKAGYTFAGWYSDATYNNKITKVTGTDKDITVYAKWIRQQYKINYHLNGGTNNKANPTVMASGSKVSLKAPTRKGYEFAGWYKEASFKNKVTSVTAASGTINLYAKWIKVTYKITYKLNAGSNNKVNLSKYYVTSKTINLKAPTRKGYVFAGWYKDSKYKSKITSIKQGSTGNVIVYAKWKKVTVEKVTIGSLQRGKKSITVKVKKCLGAKGYKIVYSTNKNFSHAKTVMTTSTTKKLNNLSKNKKYYVKVCAYKLDSKGKNVYGPYSKTKAVKTK